MLQVRVLGPVEVAVGDRLIDLGGPKPRLALTLLLLEPNRTVSADRLIETLWDGSKPADPRAALQVNISNLRRALDGADLTIDFANGGYVARLDPDTIDARRFVELVATGTRLVATDPQTAATVLRDALALWHGRPFGDLGDEPALAAEVTRLEDARLQALDQRIAADLALGHHERCLEDLRGLTAEHPLREGFWGKLVLALYRSGRQGDALAAYERAATRLQEELGVDPSPALQELQKKVLRQDDSLDAPAPRGIHQQDSAPERTIRGYALLEEVREGRLGTIHRARQPGSGRPVAIEVVAGELADDPELVRRFGTVTAQAARLDHPGIAGLEDAWRRPGEACLVSTWVAGRTLRSGDGERWEPAEVADLVADVAGALDHAQRAGLPATDLSPHDIVVDDTGRAVLTNLAAISLDVPAPGRRRPLTRTRTGGGAGDTVPALALRCDGIGRGCFGGGDMRDLNALVHARSFGQAARRDRGGHRQPGGDIVAMLGEMTG